MPTMTDQPTEKPQSMEARRQRTEKRIRLMPDTGVFPLWTVRGGLTHVDAREFLGLEDDLVDDLQQWGWEDDFVKGPPGGWDAWHERGLDLHRRLQEALGPDFEVVFEPGRPPAPYQP